MGEVRGQESLEFGDGVDFVDGAVLDHSEIDRVDSTGDADGDSEVSGGRGEVFALALLAGRRGGRGCLGGLGRERHKGRVGSGVGERGIAKIARDAADILLDRAVSSFGWASLGWDGRGRCCFTRLWFLHRISDYAVDDSLESV